MKKLLTLVLALILACGMFAAGGLAENDPVNDAPMYYIPGVSHFYHADPNCKAVSSRLRPMQASFPLSDAAAYSDLRPCKSCGAPKPVPVDYAPAELFEYTVKADGTAEITKADQTISNGNIPAELDGHAVTSIGEHAFDSCVKLTGVVLPATVTTLQGYAFTRCRNLESIRIPSSVTFIGSHAFSYTDSLEEVSIPEGVTGLEPQTFFMSGLKSLKIPASLTSIGYGCFNWCSSLASIEIAPGNPVFEVRGSLLVNKRENALVYHMDTDSGSYELPDGLEKIGHSAFFNTSLEEVILPDSVKEMEGSVFFQAQNLNTVRLPAGLKYLPDYTFSNCRRLESVVIPDGVVSIGRSAFYNCRNLREVVIPAKVTRIDSIAFEEAYSVIVKVHAGSYAQNFCKANGIRFEVLPE